MAEHAVVRLKTFSLLCPNKQKYRLRRFNDDMPYTIFKTVRCLQRFVMSSTMFYFALE
jgi:hypothetical protein